MEAAYLSAPRVVTRVRLLPIDPFPNYERIKDVKCPIVMLHGTADSIIPYSHGRKLFDLAPKPKWFIPVDDVPILSTEWGGVDMKSSCFLLCAMDA